jgi:hypothetical protein
MVNRDAFKQPVGDLDQRLQGVEKTLQAAQSEIADVRKAMAALANHSEPTAVAPRPARLTRIAIANGRRLTAAEFAKLDEEDYDVVLNLTNGTLRVRRKPGSPSKLKRSPLKKIGGHRIEVLEYMLTHPGRHFSADTVYGRFGEKRLANTFTKTISTLRQALGTPGPQNPYILTAPAWEESAQARACIYVLNEKHNYLVIRSSEEVTGNSP